MVPCMLLDRLSQVPAGHGSRSLASLQRLNYDTSTL